MDDLMLEGIIRLLLYFAILLFFAFGPVIQMIMDRLCSIENEKARKYIESILYKEDEEEVK